MDDEERPRDEEQSDDEGRQDDEARSDDEEQTDDGERPERRPSRRKKWLLIAAGALVLVVGTSIGVYVWFTSDPADPVDVADVVANYRSISSSTPASSTPSLGTTATPTKTGSSPATSSVEPPQPGVYVYDTSGDEGVDALGGSNHTYPRETTITMTLADDGCVQSRWDVLRQRWDEETHCPTSDGWELERKTVFHSFFRQSEKRDFVCDPGSVEVPHETSSGTTVSARCSSAGGSRSGASSEDITGEVVGIEPIIVAGQEVDTVHLRYEIAIGGESEGSAHVDRWIARDTPPLLVRETREGRTTSDTVIGDVHYDEAYEMTLRNLEPIE